MNTKIFVSSRMNKSLKKWRELAYHIIKDELKLAPILFEKEPPDSKHIIEWWRGKVKESEIYILILNKTLSAAVFDEFRTAYNNHKKILIFTLSSQMLKERRLEIKKSAEKELAISDEALSRFYDFVNSRKHKKILKKDTYGVQFMIDFKKGIFQYDPKATLPIALRSYCIEDDDSEMKRIKEVYVKPGKIYDEASDKLKKEHFLIIAGPPNVGKTSMAYYLASKRKGLINSDETPAGILKMSGELLPELKNVKNFVILFDDVFGKSKSEPYYANRYEAFLKLKDKNFLILTSRENILNEIKDKRTRFAEFSEYKINNVTIKIEQEGSYTDEELGVILKNHLEYYLKTRVINKKEKEYALKHKDEIISKLRFPHNYELFVRVELKKILENEISFNKAIDNAKNIKRVVKKWFLNLSEDEKYFVFTVAFFPYLNEGNLERVYEEVIKILQKNSSSSINVLRKETSSYITETGVIDFKHPTYWEGVWDGIRDKFETELRKIIPVLEKFVKNKDPYVRSKAVDALGEIGRAVPDKVLPVLEKLAKDKDFYVRFGTAIALGAIGGAVPDKVLPVLEKLAKDKDHYVRSSTAIALGEFGGAVSDKVLPILKKLAKDKDHYVRSSTAIALGEFGGAVPDKVLPVLEKLAKDKDSYVRSSIAIALKEIGRAVPDKVLPVLKKLAKDKDSYVRSSAVSSLGEIGRAVPDKVLPILKKLAK